MVLSGPRHLSEPNQEKFAYEGRLALQDDNVPDPHTAVVWYSRADGVALWQDLGRVYVP